MVTVKGKETFLERYGQFASRDPELVIAAAIIITVFMGISTLALDIETDFLKSVPQDLDAIKNQNLLTEVFAESESLFVVAEIDASESGPGTVRDIRDPEIMRKLYDLEQVLRLNPEINFVYGAPDALVQSLGSIPEDADEIKTFFGSAQNIFGFDYSITTLTMRLNGEPDGERVSRLSDRINDEIDSIGFPGSVNLEVTGGPIVGKTISDLIFEDLYRTMSVAVILILITLSIAYKSPMKGLASIVVLMFAVVWTGGTMSLIGVPLSIVTVTVGSLVIGIGIDYTIHIMNRYDEEKGKRRDEKTKKCLDKHGKYDECMRSCFICYGVAVDRVGKAIIGTAVTTVSSFLALVLSGVPFLADMGIALSIGIFYAMALSLFVLPSLLSIQERAHIKIREMMA